MSSCSLARDLTIALRASKQGARSELEVHSSLFLALRSAHTSSRGLVAGTYFRLGRVSGTSPLKGLHAGTCYTSKEQNLRRFHLNLGKRRGEKGVVLNSETEVTKF